MEHKKTFGSFILQRRKELGLTQKEFASQLFVTESAVSKWERGLSYPDITLLQNICSVLQVSEHELLSGSEDTRQRNSDRLAERYIRLCRNSRLSQYIIYGGILLLCAIINIATVQRLDWFFIALPSVLICASLTLVPSLCALDSSRERYSRPISFGCFTLSLLLLLLSICIYTGGRWFAVAAASCLFFLSLVALPFLLPRLPLPDKLSRCKLSIYLAFETFMLLFQLLVICIYTGGDWFVVAAVSILFGLGFPFLPVFLRQFPLPEDLKNRKASLFLGVQTALLLLQLLVICVYTGGRWFFMAAVSILFGLGLVFLPIVLRQLPLPGKYGRNRLLLYFSIESLLLLLTVLLGVAHTARFSSPAAYITDTLVTLLMLSLPWGLMLLLRYLPADRYFRFSAACGFSALWLWTCPILMDAAMAPVYGWRDGTNNYTLATPFISADLNSAFSPGWFWFAAVLVALAAAAIVLALLGLRRRNKPA